MNRYGSSDHSIDRSSNCLCFRSKRHKSEPSTMGLNYCSTQLNIWTHTNIYPYTYTHMYTHAYTHIHVHSQAYVHTYTRTVRVLMHTPKRTQYVHIHAYYMHSSSCTHIIHIYTLDIHTHTCIHPHHTPIHPCMKTHTHARTFIYMQTYYTQSYK